MNIKLTTLLLWLTINSIHLFGKIGVEDFDSRILDQGKNVTLGGHRKIFVPQNSQVVFKATSGGQVLSFDLSDPIPKECGIKIAIYNQRDKRVRHTTVNHGQPHEMYMLAIDEPVLVVLDSLEENRRCPQNRQADLIVSSSKPLYIGK